MALIDYLIDQTALDWPELLRPWHWALPPEFTLWIVNRFGDPFIVPPDGTIHVLRTDSGQLERLADSREHFAALLDLGNNANDWFLIPLVDRLVTAGLTLGHGQCYGFKTPPVLGGDYVPSNIVIYSLSEHLAFLAYFHQQITDLPDGAHVTIRLTDESA